MAGSQEGQSRNHVDSVCHFEIGVRDYDRVKKFYSAVFNWRFEAGSQGHESIRTGHEVGGHLHVRNEPRNYTVMYIMVDDVAAAIARAESAGGKVVLGPEKEGEHGLYAWIADPEGNVVGVYTQK